MREVFWTFIAPFLLGLLAFILLGYAVTLKRNFERNLERRRIEQRRLKLHIGDGGVIRGHAAQLYHLGMQTGHDGNEGD